MPPSPDRNLLQSSLPGPPKGLWAQSLSASTLVHVGAIALAVGTLPALALRGQDARASSVAIVFAAPDRVPELPEPEPEPELEVEVARLDELPEVRPLELAAPEFAASVPDDVRFLPVDLRSTPLERCPTVAVPRHRPPVGAPISADPVALPPADVRPEPQVERADPAPTPPAVAAGAETAPDAPRKIGGDDPSYPRRARALGQQGSVVCRLTIGADGDVRDVSVERSSGFPMLDRAALDGLTDWRFEPARRAGRAVETDVLHTVRFEL